MPDFGYSQDEFDRFFREMGWLLQMMFDAGFTERLFTEEKDFVTNVSDVNVNFDLIELEGLDLGVNTMANGEMPVRVTLAMGVYTVKLYKATGGGGGDEVATGAGAAGATIAITELNGSGISGSIKLKNPATAEATDKHRLRAHPSFKNRAKKIWNGDLATDGALLSQAFTLCDAIAAAVKNIRTGVMLSALSGFFIASARVRGALFLGNKESALVTDVGRALASGTVERTRGGALDRLSDVMADNSTGGGEQSVVELVPSVGGVTYGTDNTGEFTVAVTAGERTPNCRLVLKCTDDTIGAETFSLEFFPLDPAGSLPPLQGTIDPVTIKKPYSGPYDVGITITRNLEKTGDGPDEQLSPVADCTIDKESAENTSDGTLWWQIFENGVVFDVGFFNANSVDGDGNFKSVNRVAFAQGYAANALFEASPDDEDTDPTINWKMGTAPVAGSQGTLLLHCPSADNGNAGASQDSAECEISVPAGGKVNQVLRDNTGATLHSDALGSETIPDTLITAGSLVVVADDVP